MAKKREPKPKPVKLSNREKRILSLDASSTAMGWCFYVDSVAVAHGEITVTKSWPAAKRVMHMIDKLRAIINQDEIFGGKIDLAVFEDGIYCRDFAGSFSLGGALMSAEIFLMRNGIPCDKIMVQQWKKILTGKGNAHKDAVAMALFDKGVIKGCVEFIDEKNECLSYRGEDGILETISFDRTDAIGIGWAYINDNA